jgi:GH15 family glucan-1,4-alpha-glucosidase
MAARLEDYALIGDCHSAALVSRDGSIDWLCLPRFDSGACFAALLGTETNGCWRLAPAGGVKSVSRRYEPGTAILATTWETESGALEVLDFMAVRSDDPHVIRIVKGLRGTVEVQSEMIFRFDYGTVVPWVTRRKNGIDAIAGPDMLRLTAPVRLENADFKTRARFTLAAGETCSFVMTWYPSNRPEPDEIDALAELGRSRNFWRQWLASARNGRPRE